MNKINNYEQLNKELDSILIQYIPSNKLINLEGFIENSITTYNNYSINILPFNYFFYKIINSTIELNKKNYKNFIKYYKKYKIFNYYSGNKIEKALYKYFPKLSINCYFFKHRNKTFFNSKYKLFKNKRISYILYLINKNGLFKSLKYIFTNKIYLNYLELVITTKCSLKCKDCANLMYMYKKPYDIDSNTIINSIKKLFKVVNKIEKLRILGGEPFCNQNLKKYLELLPIDKINNIWIVTNGTIVPKDNELYKIIREKNIKVEISDYGKLSFQKEKLIEKLESENINYVIKIFNSYWLDYGKLVDYKSNSKELNKQFKRCNMDCKSLLNGCIYYCPREAHGIDLNIIKPNKGEYIDLINNDSKECKKALKKLLFRTKSIEACKYCKYQTDKCIKIKPAIQKMEK